MKRGSKAGRPRGRRDYKSFEVYITPEYEAVLDQARLNAKRMDRSLSRYILWATLKALENLVGHAMDANKELFIEDFGEEGVERVAARLPDGTAVAHVTRAGGDKKRPVVLDEAALLAWAEENAPGYVIVEPEKVVPARRTVAPALLDALTIVDNVYPLMREETDDE